MKKKNNDKTPATPKIAATKISFRKRAPFTRFADSASHWAGTSSAFALAIGTIVVWSLTGPLFGFSDTWQIVINTATTIVTFLLVFLIQHSQNRDTRAIHLKLDELIRATKGAHTVLLDLERLSEEELESIHARYEALAHEARMRMRDGKSDTGIINIALKHS